MWLASIFVWAADRACTRRGSSNRITRRDGCACSGTRGVLLFCFPTSEGPAHHWVLSGACNSGSDVTRSHPKPLHYVLLLPERNRLSSSRIGARAHSAVPAKYPIDY